ncbi:DUF6483 family protein [Acutalibacter sp.]|uniref:DUF6483 family protein n=1 Tax=Acutalibacter sp. TaxID=1918636 RepID=UPI002170647A|nr:hypothetical protein [Acutalibacter sp.]
MFVQQDWLMRQIEMMVSTILRLLSLEASRDSALPEESRQSGSGDRQGGSGQLAQALTSLLRQGQLGKAEDLLFEHLDPEDEGVLAAALDFYRQANALTDGELEAQGFTREELLEGLSQVAKRYGLCFFEPGPA